MEHTITVTNFSNRTMIIRISAIIALTHSSDSYTRVHLISGKEFDARIELAEILTKIADKS